MIAIIAKRLFGLIPWWLWPIALAMSVASGFTAYEHASAEAAKAKAELSDYRREAETALRAAEQKARETETALRSQSEQLRTALAKEIQNAQEAQARLVAGIRAGTQRMSIAARCGAAETGADPGAPPGDGAGSARAELDPEAAEALVSIAADGDNAIRERNACIAAYEQVRQSLSH